MRKKLRVGNLASQVTDQDVIGLFKTHGTVKTARIVLDRDTGEPKGYAFVTMTTKEEAQAAIAALNGAALAGQQVTVRQARIRPGGKRGTSPS